YNSSGDVWAPDVSYHNGRVWMYYSASSFGSNRSAIGLATSPTGLPGSWRDQGVVYRSSSSDDFNAIDPSLFVDPASGKWWLSFGSHWTGIKMISINPQTGKPSTTDRTRYNLAQRPSPGAVEAPYILARGGYYYLFVSFDACCQGVNSTYRIMVGR
nr:arabinan endo-1,5-alpha-L-arabinosidase [Micromonospora sp. DSM 115978]